MFDPGDTNAFDKTLSRMPSYTNISLGYTTDPQNTQMPTATHDELAHTAK